jgi:hypothetical protein
MTKEITELLMGKGSTVFLVDWRAPTGNDPDGDIVVEEIRMINPNFQSWSRGSHYRDYFQDGEVAYRYAEAVKAEFGIKGIFGSWESHQRYKAEERRYLLEVEELEARRRNNIHGRLLRA